MSQGNILQGQASGKLGDTVLMVRNGLQVARVYTKAGARSGSAASEASRIQRVRFGSASNQWSVYRYVSTRMYRKGKAGNLSDYNYFVKRNSGLLPYLTKQENASGVHCLMPGQFSEGQLGRIDLTLNLTAATEEGVGSLSLIDSQRKLGSAVSWNATMAVMKAAFAASYSNATKVTFLLSLAPQTLEDIEGVAVTSQSVRHFAITVDLYKETRTGENAQTVKEYFAAAVDDATLSTFLAAQTAGMSSSYSMLALRSTSAEEYDLLKNLSVLLFATNENASDVYTTILPEEGVSAVRGAYVTYANYRTTEALRLACESYGYQSGVMRDEIASLGNSLQERQAAFNARLRSLGITPEDTDE